MTLKNYTYNHFAKIQIVDILNPMNGVGAKMTFGMVTIVNIAIRNCRKPQPM